MWWRRLFPRRRSPDTIYGDTRRGGYHVNVDLTFRDGSLTEERHDDKDRAEFEARQALLEARVAALEMGSRDDA